jgi:hypothetical protein
MCRDHLCAGSVAKIRDGVIATWAKPIMEAQTVKAKRQKLELALSTAQ